MTDEPVTDPAVTDPAVTDRASDAAGVEPDAGAARARSRRELGTVVLGLLAGGGLAFLCASRPWLTLTAARPAPFAALVVHVKGRTEFGAVSGLAVVLLLGAVLAMFVGRWPRTLLAVLLAGSALVLGWTAARGFTTPGPARLLELIGGRSQVAQARIVVARSSLWPGLTLVSAVIAFAAAVALGAGARRWSAGLSSRYDAPTGPSAPSPTQDPWRSLDRGDDPTIGES